MESIKTQRAKARKRTSEYRKRMKDTGRPEARSVDPIILHAIAYLTRTGEIVMRREDWIKIIEGAHTILRRHHDRAESLEMIQKRIAFHAKGEWLKFARALEREAALREAEDRAAAERQKNDPDDSSDDDEGGCHGV